MTSIIYKLGYNFRLICKDLFTTRTTAIPKHKGQHFKTFYIYNDSRIHHTEHQHRFLACKLRINITLSSVGA